MSEDQGAVSAAIEGAAGQAGGQQDGGAVGAGAGDSQQQRPEQTWQEKYLPAELRTDETVANYKSLDDFVKGAVETRRWARGRIAVPAAEDAAGFEEFAGKVRPEKAEAYKILDADGKPSETGEAFRNTFHEIGLHPIQAEKLTAAWNQFQADTVSRQTQAGKDAVTAIEMELGPQAYNMRLAAVGNMLKGAGIEIGDLVPALEQVIDAGAAMKALFTLAEKTGELAKVDGATLSLQMGTMTPESAQQAIDAMSWNKDPAFQAKLADKTSPEYAKRQALLKVTANKGR